MRTNAMNHNNCTNPHCKLCPPLAFCDRANCPGHPLPEILCGDHDDEDEPNGAYLLETTRQAVNNAFDMVCVWADFRPSGGWQIVVSAPTAVGKARFNVVLEALWGMVQHKAGDRWRIGMHPGHRRDELRGHLVLFPGRLFPRAPDEDYDEMVDFLLELGVFPDDWS